MNDILATALITGGFTSATGGLAAWLSYLSGKRQGELSLATVRAQAETERQRISDEAREQERSRRAHLYSEFLDSCNEFDLMAGGWAEFTHEALDAWVSRYW